MLQAEEEQPETCVLLITSDRKRLGITLSDYYAKTD
jgi:hypothetical protein